MKSINKYFKQPLKHFLSHSIFTIKYGDPNLKHPIHCLKEIICKYQHKENMIKQEKLAKNTSIYQNLIAFTWASASKKKHRKHFETIIDFYFYYHDLYRTK